MFLNLSMDTLNKVAILEELAQVQERLGIRSDPSVMKAINVKSLEILKEI